MSIDTQKRGIIMREAHFPGTSVIDAYGDGGFRFAEMSHRGSILCLPSGIFGWDVQNAAEITVDALEPVWAVADQLEVFFIGTGADFDLVSRDVKSVFKDHNIMADPMNTGAAIRTYNVLLGEGRAVGCCLIAVG